MIIDKEQIASQNQNNLDQHNLRFNFTANSLIQKGVDVDSIIKKVSDFQVAIPSWALGAGGTRFGRFSFYGEPGTLEQKIEDVGLIHALTQSAGAISLHIPWDVPEDAAKIKSLTKSLGLQFDAMNSNTFQDQPDQEHSYKYGSLCSTDDNARQQAIQHNIDVIKLGEQLGSKSLTVWLADGSSFPGQNNFQTVLKNTQDSIKQIYAELPEDWKLFIEYKPYEPYFYSTVIQDWGTSFMLANECGPKAYTLVDLGHHLPNTNIEQIVATLMLKGKLGGFHFNDSKYGDDDLTVGSIKPYSLFLIFNELVYGMENNPQNPYPAWMIDASHNLKDPLEDLMQSLEAINSAYAKALLVDQEALREAQRNHDVTLCQEILQEAYLTDVRPLLEKARVLNGGAINPLQAYRQMDVRNKLVDERGKHSMATGL
ncbi:TIM barrel protein [Allomuricauda sp. NBRC 101325]|uniref:TIM barrel protein n=1 Tax=Allomuricauda sp. NBRC 101325 TaxID=1113758 RepID=UPI0024A2A07C|nr:TIM barrel protein [Muricauda sp. NBRC 101325]GLU44928.1 L-rhamnose catabolism isomerase [Muricauda sp. NBRC 101325]